MCGRFTLRASPAELAQAFDLFREEPLTPRYNIAPTQLVPVIRAAHAEGTGGDAPAFEAEAAPNRPAALEQGERFLSMMKWGLIPSWSKDAKGAARLINARAETIEEKASFRTAFKRRRCLIPADGFYEWKALDRKTKQPFLIGLASREPFAFAGLWETWRSPEGEKIESCSIITTEANALMAELHDRMPVVLARDEYDPWLDPECGTEALRQLLDPYPADEMQYVPVSPYVNNARNEGPECVDPAASPSAAGDLFSGH